MVSSSSLVLQLGLLEPELEVKYCHKSIIGLHHLYRWHLAHSYSSMLMFHPALGTTLYHWQAIAAQSRISKIYHIIAIHLRYSKYLNYHPHVDRLGILRQLQQVCNDLQKYRTKLEDHRAFHYTRPDLDVSKHNFQWEMA